MWPTQETLSSLWGIIHRNSVRRKKKQEEEEKSKNNKVLCFSGTIIIKVLYDIEILLLAPFDWGSFNKIVRKMVPMNTC